MKAGDKDPKREKQPVVISHQAIRRFPYYLEYLKKLKKRDPDENARVSASSMASDLRLYEVLVRKDLAAVSRVAGKPRVGFNVLELIEDIEHFLGYDNLDIAALAGVGNLGHALLSYRGFKEYGLDIAAAFDTNASLHGKAVGDCEVFPMEKMRNLCRRLGIKIGIIAVPHNAAQEVCDLMIESGIKAVWNFAPMHLDVPEGILVQNENMAASLAVLSKYLASEVP